MLLRCRTRLARRGGCDCATDEWGTLTMAVITYRQALHDTLGRGDGARPECGADGRGDRQVRGLVQDHRGLADRVRQTARGRYADRRGGLRRPGDRRGDARPAPGRRDHDDQLQPAGDRPDRQSRRQDPLHVRRPGARADGDPHATGGVGQLAATHSQNFENWFAYCPA